MLFRSVHESFHGYGSAFSAVKPKAEKPIQSLMPDPSWGFLGDTAEKSGLLMKSVKPALVLKPALSLGGLEDNKGEEKEGRTETKDDAGSSYNEDECVKTALQKKKLLSSDQTSKSPAHEDSSNGDSPPQGTGLSKKRNAVRQQPYRNKKKLKQGMVQLV